MWIIVIVLTAMGAPGSVGNASLQGAVIGCKLVQKATLKKRTLLLLSVEIVLDKRCTSGIGIILLIPAVVLLFQSPE